MGAVGTRTERTLVDEGGGIIGGQVVPGGGIDIQTHAEGRIFHRTGNDTKLHVDTCTINLTIVTIADNTAIGAVGEAQAFGILAIALVFHIVDTNGDTPVETIIGITAEGEVELIDPATMGAVEIIGIAIHTIVHPTVINIIIGQNIGIQIVELAEIERLL